MMNVFDTLTATFHESFKFAFNLSPQQIARCELVVNVDEQKQAFGDVTTNAAMILAKELKQNPRVIAQEICNNFKHAFIEKIEIAGPGFINLYLTQDAFTHLAQELFKQKEAFFTLNQTPKDNISLEFVSANPTGPLHFGHGRGGIIGDVLTRILKFIGYDATPEYYINDAGAQIIKLGLSLKIRCQQALDHDVPLPEDAYHGSYLIDVAKTCLSAHGEKILEKNDQFFASYAQDQMLAKIKETLTTYGISFDVWFSEKSLHTSGAIAQALETLENRNLLYEKDNALWFASTTFGDDKDRVVRKADGTLTYIAADIAYLLDKVNRGHNKLIMVLGHDHHSYVTRLETVRQGLGLDDVTLDVILYQLVKIKEGNLEVRMSKRAGNIITLDDVVEAVGPDVARFFYLHRKADAQLEFDLDLARKKTDENPVHYVQYAYVRTNSIIDKAMKESTLHKITTQDLAALGTEEQYLLKKIASLKLLLEQLAGNYQTHLLSYYIIELANAFHAYYSHNRIIDLESKEKSRARLALIIILNNTFKVILDLLGISSPQRM